MPDQQKASSLWAEDTEASVFNELWPEGFIEDFEGNKQHGCNVGFNDVVKAISATEFMDSSEKHDLLEIGPGGGLWTRFFSQHFKTVTAVDVVPLKFKLPQNVVYITVPDRSFDCFGIQKRAYHRVWSFGVFPHLSIRAQSAYLASLYQRMTMKGSSAVIHFANWERHRDKCNIPDRQRFANISEGKNMGAWFYNNLQLTNDMISAAGFFNFVDLIPNFRDTLAYFSK